jgi:sugar transferase (PEP-CTERM/EpsH1 system associated)
MGDILLPDILFLAHRVPYPPDRGDKIRSWHILKALCGFANVHVAALCDDARDRTHVDFLRTYATSVKVFPRQASHKMAVLKALALGGSASVRAFANRDMAVYVQQVLREQNISTIFAFSGQMAQYVPLGGSQLFVMDFVDMDSAKYAEWGTASGLKGAANRFEAKRLFAFERQTARRADVSLFVSAAEADLFRDQTGLGADKVQVLENGIDLERYAPDASAVIDPSLIVFTGQMDYTPNVEAVVDFVRDVWPKVLTTQPDATFAIVGRNPTPEVRALASDSITVTGEVADPREWLAKAALAVAPLKLARGVQNKVLEAMAMGKAVLASSAAAQGIDARAGRDLIVADDAEAQAAAILHLLTNPADAAKVGQAARAQMEARYGWDAQLAGLPALVGVKA